MLAKEQQRMYSRMTVMFDRGEDGVGGEGGGGGNRERERGEFHATSLRV